MDIFLGHLDYTPIFYGVIMFFGIWSVYHKFTTWNVRGFLIEAGVFMLVFTLHGGTMSGGFAAMTCALLAGFVLGRRRKT